MHAKCPEITTGHRQGIENFPTMTFGLISMKNHDASIIFCRDSHQGTRTILQVSSTGTVDSNNMICVPWIPTPLHTVPLLSYVGWPHQYIKFGKKHIRDQFISCLEKGDVSIFHQNYSNIQLSVNIVPVDIQLRASPRFLFV